MAFTHPEWSYSSNIYEVNIRQYTAEGTFQAFGKHLPRLKDMHVEILWLMPVQPISKVGRKGSLGSYYAPSDYCAINEEFGTFEDFRKLVSDAHQLGFKIIIDWVANHTGNDHLWLKQHPEFYDRDGNGEVVHPNDWSDVSHLSFEHEGIRSAMIAAMKFWITAFDIDGFRCDMAHLVPLDFWFRAHTELQHIKPELFWLAECEEPLYHNAFDATYTWEWMHASEQLYKRTIPFKSTAEILKSNARHFHPDALRVYFTSNHDENSWNGTEYEKFRELAIPLAVFSCTWNGIPMIYSGQELPNYKRLKFFEKDIIDWNNVPSLHDFYKTLFALKKRNPALLAGVKSSTEWINEPDDVNRYFAYKRRNGKHEVVVLLNFSHDKLVVEPLLSGEFINVFSKQIQWFNNNDVLHLPAFGYCVLERVIR